MATMAITTYVEATAEAVIYMKSKWLSDLIQIRDRRNDNGPAQHHCTRCSLVCPFQTPTGM